MSAHTTVLSKPATKAASAARGVIRALSPKEGVLLRDHLLRLNRDSRHDRFNGFIDDAFIGRYAERSIVDGTVIIAYLENGEVRGAAELHQPDLTPGSLPEIALASKLSGGAKASVHCYSRASSKRHKRSDIANCESRRVPRTMRCGLWRISSGPS